jgi:hypothetical protein
MAASRLAYFVGGVYIHFCGNGDYWFRPYGGSLGAKAPQRSTSLFGGARVPL